MEKPYALPSSFGTYCFEDHDIIVESILEEFPEIREDMHEITGGESSGRPTSVHVPSHWNAARSGTSGSTSTR